MTGTHLLWTSKNASYVPSLVVDAGRLFVATDQSFALCTNAKDGEMIFRERLPGAAASGRGARTFYASPVLANGHVYAVSRTGGTYVFEAKPEFKLIAQNKLSADTSGFNGTPALSGTQLFLRSNKFLYCVEDSKSTSR